MKKYILLVIALLVAGAGAFFLCRNSPVSTRPNSNQRSRPMDRTALPRIGITTAFEASGRATAPYRHAVYDTYVSAVRRAGGLPILLPNYPLNEAECDAYLDTLDGLLLIGGLDYPPEYYGRTPDSFTQRQRLNPESDLILTRAALRRELPIFGICGGAQILNIAANGKLIVHLENAPDFHAGGKSHSAQLHGSRLLAGALALPDGAKFTVNSSHHQAVDPVYPGEGLAITARASDGSVEAIEGTGKRFLLGVQFHPERLPGAGDRLFDAFIAAAKQ